nr:MAG TPA: hypothetical protein [Caudoviricetes sp.]
MTYGDSGFLSTNVFNGLRTSISTLVPEKEDFTLKNVYPVISKSVNNYRNLVIRSVSLDCIR